MKNRGMDRRHPSTWGTRSGGVVFSERRREKERKRNRQRGLNVGENNKRQRHRKRERDTEGLIETEGGRQTDK